MAKRYQGDNQNLYIIEEQTTQLPKDTKGVIRICKSYPWYLLAIVLSVLCCLYFYDIQILITPLISFGHCVVCSWGNQKLYIIEEQTTQWPKDTKGVIRTLYHRGKDNTMAKRYQGVIRICKSLKNTQHNGQKIPRGNQNLYIIEEQTCVVFSSMIYRFWLHPWYLLAILLSVLLWYTDSDYPLGILIPRV
jgi:hypothetical protein